jgi:uncharacterized membrane protein
MTKFSSGYWDIFDPTNGYTAIDARVANSLTFTKISKRYFFESDILFRLNIIRAVVIDVPMEAKYGDEVSNLKISKILKDFLFGNLKNYFKRIFYSYYLRDLSVASLELPIGLLLLLFGCFFGTWNWMESAINNSATSAGTVMISALPIITGFQLILAFINFDFISTPRIPIGPALRLQTNISKMIAHQ